MNATEDTNGTVSTDDIKNTNGTENTDHCKNETIMSSVNLMYML